MTSNSTSNINPRKFRTCLPKKKNIKILFYAMDNTRSMQKYVSTYAAQMYFIVLNNGFVNSKTINYFRWHSIDNMVNKSVREKIS